MQGDFTPLVGSFEMFKSEKQLNNNKQAFKNEIILILGKESCFKGKELRITSL